MNNKEAANLLSNKLEEYRSLTYQELVKKVDQPSDRFEINGPSGVRYQLVLWVVWDGKAHEDVRVIGDIDDSGWRAFFPLNDSFIVARDGSYVGE
jgi:hypothetical protein